jgi:VWFA-related protein
MTRLLWYRRAVGLMLLGIAPVASRQAAEQQAGAVIRVTVNLVQVDATVTDSKGRHAADLKPQDFEIFEDGKPQRITQFSYVPVVAPADAPAHFDLPPHSVSGKLPEAISRPVPALRPEEVQRTIVLMADDLGLTPDDIPRVRSAMKSFVDREMQPSDLDAVMIASGGMGSMQQLTNDKRQLNAAIERIHYFAGSRPGWTWYTPIEQPTADRLYQKAIKERLDAARSPGLSMGTFSALAYAIQGLREMPGRKAIAFFSDSFRLSPGGIIQLANRASVVIYTLDPRGFVSFDATALDAGPAAGGLKRAHEREAAYHATQTSLEQLARGTGGIFVHEENDLAKGLATALDDMRGYYLIGYQPNRNDFDKVRGQAQFHKIEVKVLRAGLSVRSGNGFAGIPDSPPVSEDAVRKSGKEELRRALASPFHSNAFPVQLSAFNSAEKRNDRKTGRRPIVLRAMLAIDARGLRFSDTPKGKKELDLDIAAAAYGADNEVVTSSDRTFHVAMTPDEANGILASGLLYGFEMEILRSGPYQLRVAAWDANSEKVGSATTFVEIPDLNRKGIALSSVRLHDSDAQRNDELTRAGVIGAGSSVTRMFASGAVLTYDFTVYGPRTDPQTGKPKVAMLVRLFRGPEQIYNGQPIPLTMSGGDSDSAIPGAGVVKLPPTLPPGDYALELSVYDELEKRPQSATQWVDFTLVK